MYNPARTLSENSEAAKLVWRRSLRMDKGAIVTELGGRKVCSKDGNLVLTFIRPVFIAVRHLLCTPKRDYQALALDTNNNLETAEHRLYRWSNPQMSEV